MTTLLIFTPVIGALILMMIAAIRALLMPVANVPLCEVIWVLIMTIMFIPLMIYISIILFRYEMGTRRIRQYYRNQGKKIGGCDGTFFSVEN